MDVSREGDQEIASLVRVLGLLLREHLHTSFREVSLHRALQGRQIESCVLKRWVEGFHDDRDPTESAESLVVPIASVL
jgi:hypothetical protein